MRLSRRPFSYWPSTEFGGSASAGGLRSPYDRLWFRELELGTLEERWNAGSYGS